MVDSSHGHNCHKFHQYLHYIDHPHKLKEKRNSVEIEGYETIHCYQEYVNLCSNSLLLAVTVMCCPMAMWTSPIFKCAMIKFSPTKLIRTSWAKNLSLSVPHSASVCVESWPSFPTQGPQISLPWILFIHKYPWILVLQNSCLERKGTYNNARMTGVNISMPDTAVFLMRRNSWTSSV